MIVVCAGGRGVTSFVGTLYPEAKMHGLLKVLAALTVGCCTVQSVHAQLVVTLLGELATPNTVVDQYGDSFVVAGLSGVCSLGGDQFAAVMDNSNRVVLFDLHVASDGTIGALTNVRGLTLAGSGDYEGIAMAGVDRLLISDESSATLDEYDLTTGVAISTMSVPPVFDASRPNLGLESLAIDADAVWTSNEEALLVDGFEASPTSGTVVRLLSQSLSTGVEIGQWTYFVEPMHGAFIPPGDQGQSGLSALVALPGGDLLAIERSFALASPLFLTRMYAVGFQGATEVSGEDSLLGLSVTPVTKTLVYQGSHANLEGMCLGPSLGTNSRAMIGVVDNGDPISENTIVVFRLDGLEPSGGCVGDLADEFGSLPPQGGPDGQVGFGDFLALLGLVGPCPGSQLGCTGDIADEFGSLPPQDGPDGLVGFGDFLALLGLVGPCP